MLMVIYQSQTCRQYMYLYWEQEDSYLNLLHIYHVI